MDLTWYSKRIALAGILSGAKVHMATDFSPGFIDTWKFIDDKVEVRIIHTARSLGTGLQEMDTQAIQRFPFI